MDESSAVHCSGFSSYVMYASAATISESQKNHLQCSVCTSTSHVRSLGAVLRCLPGRDLFPLSWCPVIDALGYGVPAAVDIGKSAWRSIGKMGEKDIDFFRGMQKRDVQDTSTQ